MSQGASRRGSRILTRRCVELCVAAVVLIVPATASASTVAPTYSGGHPYRHGAVPFRGRQQTVAANPPGTAPSSANNLVYGGAIRGVGVSTGAEKIYLVFWGSQWRTQGTNDSGYATFTGDSKGVAPVLQGFFKGLGTGGETWSGVLTQYCQGVATGAQTCPAANAQHAGYPTGGALAGVWEDNSGGAPAAATAHQIGAEAVKAATHFANTTQTVNRDTQYVIISPPRTNPDAYKTGGFCAWHDYTGDATLDGGGAVPSGDGLLAFTNLPYLPDAGASCGEGFVNNPGTLDGVTIVEGHEYAETVTDQYPAGGWTDSGGAEDGDKCAWISSGQGASQDLSLTTGSYPVQSTWANDFNGGAGGCEVSHAIVRNPSANTVTVTNPGSQTTTSGASVSLQIAATDSASGQTLTFAAGGLPAGLTINASTGLITGTPTTPATSTVTVTVTDATGAAGTTSFSWTVNPASGCTATQLIVNRGFETGSAAPWTASSGVINSNGAGETGHTGNWYAWLDGDGTATTDTLGQTVSIPSGCASDKFSFWLHIDSADSGSVAHDKLTVQVIPSGPMAPKTLATFSNLNQAAGYVPHAYNLAAFAGQTVTLKFTGVEDVSLQTSFVIDDAALNVS